MRIFTKQSSQQLPLTERDSALISITLAYGAQEIRVSIRTVCDIIAYFKRVKSFQTHCHIISTIAFIVAFTCLSILVFSFLAPSA